VRMLKKICKTIYKNDVSRGGPRWLKTGTFYGREKENLAYPIALANLVLQDSLKSCGRCKIVMDEGVLFRTNENAFVQTKRKLLNECNLWCVVSLPPKAFVNAG